MFTHSRLSSAVKHIHEASLHEDMDGQLAGILTPFEFALFKDEGIEAPPTEEEMALLIKGCEERILSSVLTRINKR